MNENTVNTGAAIVVGCGHIRLGRRESFEKALQCLELLKKISGLQLRDELLRYVKDADAKLSDLPTTKKEINLLHLKTLLHVIRNLIDVIELSTIKGDCGGVDRLKTILYQTSNFAIENASTLASLKTKKLGSKKRRPKKKIFRGAHNTKFVDKLQNQTKADVIAMLDRIIWDATMSLNAVDASRDLKPLEDFIGHVDHAHQIVLLYKQILCNG